MGIIKLSDKSFGSSFENSIIDSENLKNEILPKSISPDLLNSEEDVRVKIINPYLESLGFNLDKDTFHEETLKFTIGTREYKLNLLGRSDTIIRIEEKTSMVVEAKKFNHALTRRDWEELRSFIYALVNDDETLPRYGVLTNGHKWVIRDFEENEWLHFVPNKKLILSTFSISSFVSKKERDVARKKVITKDNEEELINLISKTEGYLRQVGYDGERAFVELAKILLTKINEDRRFINDEEDRFKKDLIIDLENTLDKSVNEIVNDFFENAKKHFRNIFRKDQIININDREVLLKIIKLYEPYILYRLDFDLFGIVYEKFFADIFKGETGKYFTPREVIDFMVEFADIEIGEKVCDPSCGSGGFLTRAYQNLRTKVADLGIDEENLKDHDLIQYIEENCIIGNDIDPHLVTLAKINMVIHGDGWNNIYRSDVFELKDSPLTDWHNTIDVILANPPFSIGVNGEKLKDYKFGKQNTYKNDDGQTEAISDLLFVERCYRLLRPGGRMLIVLPSGWANNPNSQYFRDYLYDKWIEIATVSLPEGVFKPFGESGAKTVIFYLKKPYSEVETQDDVLKVNINSVGYDHRSKHYKKIPRNDLNTVLQTDEFINFKQKIYLDREKDKKYRDLREMVNKYGN